MNAILLVAMVFSFECYADNVKYFIGEDRVKSTRGDFVSPKLVMRSVDRKNQVIEEEVIRLDSRTGKFLVESIKLIVEGSNFSVLAGGYTGKGELFGLPWEWNAWRTTINLGDGSRSEVIDYLDKQGLKATSHFYDSSNDLVAVTFTTLNFASESSYLVLKRRLVSEQVPVQVK